MKAITIIIVLVIIAGLYIANNGCKTVTKSVKGCRCIHKSWAGLGSCDTCSCKVGILC